MKSISNDLISSLFFYKEDFTEICDLNHDHQLGTCKSCILFKILDYTERAGANQESLFIKITSVKPYANEKQIIDLNTFSELNGIFDKNSLIRVDRKAKDIHQFLNSEVSPFFPRKRWLSTDLFKSHYLVVLECLKNYNKHFTKIDIVDLEKKIAKLKNDKEQ